MTTYLVPSQMVAVIMQQLRNLLHVHCVVKRRRITDLTLVS